MTYDEARALGYEIDQVVPLSLIDAALPLDKESRGGSVLWWVLGNTS